MEGPPRQLGKRRRQEPDNANAKIITAEEVKKLIDSLKFTQPLSVLDRPEVAKRRMCEKCNRTRQFYCFNCLDVMQERAHPGNVELPVKVHVILHPDELRSKATSVQAAALSKDVNLYTYPELPQGDLSAENTLMIYPADNAKTLPELAEAGELDAVKNLVFIDSTWQQSKVICRDEKVKAMARPVVLNDYRTLFWRFQNTGDERFLATVEAIYYLVRDMHVAKGNPYHGQFDNLLYYYIFQFAMIQRHYHHRTDEKFTPRHQAASSYIRKEVDFSYLLEQPKEDAAPQEDKAASSEGEDRPQKKKRKVEGEAADDE
eukprot:TRINITY_DN976_c0_g2_i5.p1 TRINITY_DN976_c0_g2~~TRINITY_DN976_c0_g2_i5.p1  ORF type:complete len:317 (+),score=147.04 TRINITY_DN976_c0_g2_i5:58-1008(+)